MKENKEIAALLLEHGIKPSVQRLAIMAYLLSHRTHPTVDDIYRDLFPQMPTLSKTTIYNTLTLFVQSGIVLSLDIDSKNTHYDGDTTPHAHGFCVNCQQIFDCRQPTIHHEPSEEFSVTETQVYYKGICKNCQNN